MKGLFFINTNNIKKGRGFLLFDIIIGFTIFFVGTYCLLGVSLRSYYLLQTLIKKCVEYNKQLALVRCSAFHIPWHSFGLEVLFKVFENNYELQKKQVICIMTDHAELILNVVAFKKYCSDKQSYLCYMIQSE
ncbi:hypothetical protein EKK58_04475 [Candidatus Dependentiae bacterium]|nr:MAG: hypothetical protein EKK58_04475 [Candidatus Dependentiae bacterium]